jgi:hypothetical protein
MRGEQLRAGTAPLHFFAALTALQYKPRRLRAKDVPCGAFAVLRLEWCRFGWGDGGVEDVAGFLVLGNIETGALFFGGNA